MRAGILIDDRKKTSSRMRSAMTAMSVFLRMRVISMAVRKFAFWRGISLVFPVDYQDDNVRNLRVKFMCVTEMFLIHQD